MLRQFSERDYECFIDKGAYRALYQVVDQQVIIDFRGLSIRAVGLTIAVAAPGAAQMAKHSMASDSMKTPPT